LSMYLPHLHELNLYNDNKLLVFPIKDLTETSPVYILTNKDIRRIFMSNIIVLSGSPRKGGNTDLLVDTFVKGAEKNNNVEVVSVADYKINPCIGCNSCFDRAGHECFQQDDMQVVYDKLKCADVIVVASPVYFYGVSAQLKAIIDRLHTPMRNDFKVKKLALILVGAAVLPELFDSIKIQYQLVLNFFKLEDAGMVLVRGAKDKGDVSNTDGLDEAYRLGLAMEG
jgi:multimeric flavodoxin WrbA